MRVIVVFLIALLFAPAADATEKTIIKDQAEAQKLLGKHSFSTYDISRAYGYLGSAKVINKDGVFLISGHHANYWLHRDNEEHGGSVSIEGKITSIKKGEFHLFGTVIYKNISYSSTTPELKCVFKGNLIFKKADSEEEDNASMPESSWRMQDSNCSCNEVIGERFFLDIFPTYYANKNQGNARRTLKAEKTTACYINK